MSITEFPAAAIAVSLDSGLQGIMIWREGLSSALTAHGRGLRGERLMRLDGINPV